MATICSHCAAPLAEGAEFCRECGSDNRVGWSESQEHLLPSDYEEMVEREFGADAAAKVREEAEFGVGPDSQYGQVRGSAGPTGFAEQPGAGRTRGERQSGSTLAEKIKAFALIALVLVLALALSGIF
jgi:hypothetical protein